jgi:serine/threonine protein phosphatase 1
MFKLFKKKTAEEAIPKTYAMPVGEVVYGIGDVHGCLRPMVDLLQKIQRDRKSCPAQKSTVVFLGDLMDRGPASREVIEFLMNFSPNWTDVVYLRGNHEEVMLDVLNGNIGAMRSWFEFGGKECARSYGVNNFGQLHINPDHIMMALQRSVPKEHIQFLDSFHDAFTFGEYLLVHAGIKPRVAIEDQSPYDMRWVRSSFLDYKKPHPMKIVHGHSVVEDKPEIHSNRIAVDTGVYQGRPLTAVKLYADEEFFIQSDIIETSHLDLVAES